MKKFREFTKDRSDGNWYIDVDSGPVLAGFGISATAFGIGAARANGRFDHAYPLTAEAIVLSWPLPSGTLGWPRILSNMTHAPYVGEACLLFSMTRMQGEGAKITKAGGRIPFLVYFVLAVYIAVGSAVVSAAAITLKRWIKNSSQKTVPFEKVQFIIWAFLIITSATFFVTHNVVWGMILLLLAQFIPGRYKKNVNLC